MCDSGTRGMGMIDYCLLGTGGMQPLPHRRLSALLVKIGGDLVLLDCGEGTQIGLRECGWGLRNLKAILLTHMHADHVLGLPGLLLTLAHSERGQDEPLLICGPEPLIPVLQGLLVVAPRLPYPVEVAVLQGGERFALPNVQGVEASCEVLDHEIQCLAYGLHLPRGPRFEPERARALGVPVDAWKTLQSGQAVEIEGRQVRPEEVLGPPRRGLRLVLATDTRPTPELVAFVAADGGADLLVADAMYGDESGMPRRWKPQHLTFAEAATIARDSHARQLLLTHFSPALTTPEAYLDRATAIFPATMIGHDGLKGTLRFDE